MFWFYFWKSDLLVFYLVERMKLGYDIINGKYVYLYSSYVIHVL